MGYTILSIELSIFEPKNGADRNNWSPGHLVTWSPGHLVTWSDHPCVWALICLAQWIKIYSSSRCYSISSLLWESWRPKNGKVKTLVTNVTVTKKKKIKVVLCCFCLLLN